MLTATAVRPDYLSGRRYRHIVIAGGTVKALAHTTADAAQAAGPHAVWADLGSACIGPGFIDTHIHALQAAQDVRLVGLRHAATIGELLAALRAAARGRPAGQWTVSARNWHESALLERRLPTLAELDSLGVPGPVLLRRGSHLAVANSRALALLGQRAGPSPDAGGAGLLASDALIDRALELAGAPTAAERRDDLATVLARLAARGITSIREAGVDAEELDLFRSLAGQGRLALRCDLLWRVPEWSDPQSARRQLEAMPPGDAVAGAVRLTGVKAFVDGRIADAAIEDGQRGHFRITRDGLWAIVAGALRRSGGMGCHAVGDAAVRMVLDVYERALSTGLARQPRRLVVEHALNCSPATVRRLAASGVSVSVHPSIAYEFAADIRRHWGEAHAARAAPVRDMVRARVRVAAGSDGDVPPSDPLRGIWFMVTREGRSGEPAGEGQAVPASVALDLYTRCGAGLLGVAARRGELRPGKDADMAVLSADPLSCPVQQLPALQIVATLVGGRPVHDRGRLMAEIDPHG